MDINSFKSMLHFYTPEIVFSGYRNPNLVENGLSILAKQPFAGVLKTFAIFTEKHLY